MLPRVVLAPGREAPGQLIDAPADHVEAALQQHEVRGFPRHIDRLLH